MMSLLSVAGIRKMLNNIMNDLRPCKIKSRIEDNGIPDQIAKKVKFAKCWRRSGDRRAVGLPYRSWTDGP